MVRKIVIEDKTLPTGSATVLVTTDSKESAYRQAKALLRDVRRSARRKLQFEISPGLYALGNEAVLIAKAGGKLPKRKWRGKR